MGLDNGTRYNLRYRSFGEEKSEKEVREGSQRRKSEKEVRGEVRSEF
jgi:hypothetical protein